MTRIQLLDLFRYYKGLPHQMAAISELEEAIHKANPHILGREQAWFKTWSQDGKQPARNPLPTPYQSQRDNYRDASRTCFSSSCAMLLMTLKPGVIHSDDEYIKTVFSIGDTTDASVQIKALQQYGIKAKFVTTGNRELIQRQIDAGKPVPAGFLHHSNYQNPSGAGHWLCIIGYDNQRGGYIVNDPWGEMNVASGVYSSTSGAKQLYPYATWEPRWMPDGPSSGWCIVAEESK
jgi:hypothetical protein